MRAMCLTHRAYYTAPEMAKALGCCRQTVTRLLGQGRLPGRRVAGRWRCGKRAFRRYLAAHGIPHTTLDRMEGLAGLADAFTAGGRRRG